MQALRHEFVAEKVVKLPDANEFDPLLRNSPRQLTGIGFTAVSCSTCLTLSVVWLGLDLILVTMIGGCMTSGTRSASQKPRLQPFSQPVATELDTQNNDDMDICCKG